MQMSGDWRLSMFIESYRLLVQTIWIDRNHLRGWPQYGRCASKTVRQSVCHRARVACVESHNSARISMTEGVDALIVVPRNEKTPTSARQELDEPLVTCVEVLKF